MPVGALPSPALGEMSRVCAPVAAPSLPCARASACRPWLGAGQVGVQRPCGQTPRKGAAVVSEGN